MTLLEDIYPQILTGNPLSIGKGQHGEFFVQKVTRDGVRKIVGWKKFHSTIQPDSRLRESVATHLSCVLLEEAKSKGIAPDWIQPIDIEGDYMLSGKQDIVNKKVFDGISIRDFWERNGRKGFLEIYEMRGAADIDEYCLDYGISDGDKNCLIRYLEFEGFLTTIFLKIGIKTWDFAPKNILIDRQAIEDFKKFLAGEESFNPNMITGKVSPNIDAYDWNISNDELSSLLIRQ